MLSPWQRDGIVAPLFGTLKRNPVPGGRKFIRRYKKAFIALAKKNGKTEVASALGADLLYADDEEGAEVYSGAASRDQAALVYRALKGMVNQVPELRKMSKFYDAGKRIYIPSTDSFYQALSSDVDYSDGINPSAWIVDELHRHKSRELYDLLNEGSGTREQPLGIVITTAGFDRTSVCYEEWEYARQVANGTLEDPEFFSYVRELPEGTTWQDIRDDEELWYQPNPALGEFLRIDDLRRSVREADAKPAKQNSVLRLRFNMWTASAERWFDLGAWDACGQIVKESDYHGAEAWAGMDLASTADFAAFVLVIPKDETFVVLPRFFLPAAAIEKRTKMRDVMAAWKAEGWLHVTPGDVIDYDFIEEQIRKDADHFRIREIGFDPWNATQLSVSLADQGMEMVPVRQGFKTMSAPSKWLETLIANQQINHGGHPILRWMADNVMLESDATESIKPSKKKSNEKIDGIVALVTALERVMAYREVPSVEFYAFD